MAGFKKMDFNVFIKKTKTKAGKLPERDLNPVRGSGTKLQTFMSEIMSQTGNRTIKWQMKKKKTRLGFIVTHSIQNTLTLTCTQR